MLMYAKQSGYFSYFSDQPTEMIRVVVDDVEYHIPAQLQPHFIPKSRSKKSGFMSNKMAWSSVGA
jgi:hypothetical protein